MAEREGFELLTQSAEITPFCCHPKFCAHIYAHTSTTCPAHLGKCLTATFTLRLLALCGKKDFTRVSQQT